MARAPKKSAPTKTKTKRTRVVAILDPLKHVAPSPDIISARAQKAEFKPQPPKHYINSIVLLKSKGYSFKEIRQWLENEGCGNYAYASVYSAWLRWNKETSK